MHILHILKKDKDEITTKAKIEVEATQQRDKTKEALAARNILHKYAVSHSATFDVYDNICTLDDLIECNFLQNLKQTKLTDYLKHELNQLS